MVNVVPFHQFVYWKTYTNKREREFLWIPHDLKGLTLPKLGGWKMIFQGKMLIFRVKLFGTISCNVWNPNHYRINVVNRKPPQKKMNRPIHQHGAYDKMHPSHLGVPNFINHQPFFSAKSGFTTAKSLPNSAKTSTATPAVLTAVALRPNPSAGR